MSEIFQSSARGEFRRGPSDKQIRKDIFGMRGAFQWSVEWQLKNLGLSEEDIEGLEGKTVLDIGCGEDYKLVSYLRERGVGAEGIDPFVNGNQEYLMSRAITSSEEEGNIPRPDYHYDLVVCFSNDTLDTSFTSFGKVAKKHLADLKSSGKKAFLKVLKNKYAAAKSIITESVRVVKPNGRVIIQPGLNELERNTRIVVEEEGYEVRYEFDQNLADKWRGKEDQLARGLGIDREELDFMVHRTIIENPDYRDE